MEEKKKRHEQFDGLGFPFRVDFSHLPDTDKTNALAPSIKTLRPYCGWKGSPIVS